jgi:nucleoside-diphosphate-sugar epimerase
MTLFVFGLGYSALHVVRQSARDAAGTVTTREKAQALRGEGIASFVFDGATADPSIAGRLAAADCLLVSIPPDAAGDPVLRHFAQEIARAPQLERIIYLSTIGVYGDHAGGWVDETTEPRPVNERSRERLAAEQAWQAFAARTGRIVHVLRLAGIYGPGQNALVALRNGTARRIVKPGQVFNRIHIEDIARAVAAARAYGGEGAVWNVTDDEPAPAQDVVVFAAGLLGIAPPPEIAFDAADLSPMARSFYGESKRVANAALKARLGVELAFPTYREGLRHLFEMGEGR